MQLLDRLGITPEKRHVEQDSQEQEQALRKTLAEAETDHLFYNAAN